MKQIDFLQGFSRSLGALSVLAAGLFAPLAVSAQAPSLAAAASALAVRAQELGQVRVIVGLNVPAAPEGTLDAAAVQSQRRAISAAQAQVSAVFGADSVVRSFETFPISAEPLAFLQVVQPQVWGAEIFKTGLWVALPVVAMLMLVNLVMGLVARVAPQMNIFSIGFPVTLGVGLTGLWLTLPMMQTPMTMALERMLGYFQ